ncbi:hypothetical protein [Moritella yayanosii]|uniref:Methyl-accepting chemotaxis protein n=1 Tax=Moritella yayanosii TaxID=69539 RepID=A0A330LTH7_9GAMM|nr:hypothetical protein [Moritella yayanosii]SQD80257.1 protein of unknown function [Moritella yayanosii]
MNNLKMQNKLLLIAIVPMVIALLVALAIITHLQANAVTSMISAVVAINDMTTHIATAATEQSSVTEEINRNMIKIRNVVTQLLASSHETTQVSTDLSAAGEELETLLSQFKLS